MPSEIIYSVFVSSTYEDLREERAAVQKALLQLHCMPIGMELFGAADEETWEFIQRQIADCDYYVVLVADRYGSTASDALSYTEKEYDYAREIKKPVLAFVHGNRGGIPRDKTENDPEKRSKLEAFIEKVRRYPVSFFTAPDNLATQVMVSFVNLRERRPAVGFIRANEVPDLKKYTELREENIRLRAALLKLESGDTKLFPEASDKITLQVTVENNDGSGNSISRLIGNREVTYGEIFSFACEKILGGYDIEKNIERQICRWIIGQRRYLPPTRGPFIADGQFEKIKLRFVGRRLIEIFYKLQMEYGEERSVLAWKLTTYGQEQYGLLMP
jgi:hypothetical protein